MIMSVLSPAIETLERGVEAARKGRLAEAEAHFRRAVELDPGCAQAHCNLGNALREQGRLEEALRHLTRALERQPGLAEAGLNLAVVLEEQGRLEEAEKRLREVLERCPEHPVALNNLGSVLKKLGRLEEARACLERALARAPGLAHAHNNLGAVLEQMGRWEEAERRYDEALRWDPQLADAHANRAMVRLLKGDFERGWPEYEWRWKLRGTAPRDGRSPRWDGSPLGGRAILLQAEQGLGDTIHYVRYAALVAGRGGRVVLECPPRLCELLRSAPGVDRVISCQDPLPLCAAHAPLASLPGLFRTTLETIPNQVPYLHVASQRVEAARRRIGEQAGRRKVGLVWAGSPWNKNDRNRSIRLAELAPLAGLAGTAWFSLQRGPQAAELWSAPQGLTLTNLEKDRGDLTDTAAAILCLDLVIAVDTMIAHLAGALARPVWVLQPFAPDYRWLLHREDSPWYPTMRLFRQPAPGQWQPVIERIVKELQ
jgi:tetratricopeptide (TPR) repeat protein